MHLNEEDRTGLVQAIANQEGTAREIASWYEVTVEELRQFVEENRVELEEVRKALSQDTPEEEQPDIVTPTQLDELWIGNKFARLQRYQNIANKLYKEVMLPHMAGSDYSTALRELRSYMLAAANELGQLLHRGAGENSMGDVLNVEIEGIDMDKLR